MEPTFPHRGSFPHHVHAMDTKRRMVLSEGPDRTYEKSPRPPLCDGLLKAVR